MCLHMDIDERPERKEPLQLEFNEQSRSVLHFLCEESNPTDLNRDTGWQWFNRMVNTWQWFDRDQNEDLTTGYCCGHRYVTCRGDQLHVNFLEGKWIHRQTGTQGILRLRIHGNTAYQQQETESPAAAAAEPITTREHDPPKTEKLDCPTLTRSDVWEVDVSKKPGFDPPQWKIMDFEDQNLFTKNFKESRNQWFDHQYDIDLIACTQTNVEYLTIRDIRLRRGDLVIHDGSLSPEEKGSVWYFDNTKPPTVTQPGRWVKLPPRIQADLNTAVENGHMRGTVHLYRCLLYTSPSPRD